ncbi:hypothetical protein MKW98_026834 [Papaver atlanticum]|uniref:Uncharacterized protein n=1 Tax=Papaver atlanticum TaxID=357466 RepID=A0AAD4X6T2_9MAGN|nr:hypothetical protein MKW98_026834 [Papaver atlanticum]
MFVFINGPDPIAASELIKVCGMLDAIIHYKQILLPACLSRVTLFKYLSGDWHIGQFTAAHSGSAELMYLLLDMILQMWASGIEKGGSLGSIQHSSRSADINAARLGLQFLELFV